MIPIGYFEDFCFGWVDERDVVLASILVIDLLCILCMCVVCRNAVQKAILVEIFTIVSHIVTWPYERRFIASASG